jgi:hypothetical protein
MSLIPLGRLIVSFDGPSARQQDIHRAIAIQIGTLRHQPPGARLDERFHVGYPVVVQVPPLRKLWNRASRTDAFAAFAMLRDDTML